MLSRILTYKPALFLPVHTPTFLPSSPARSQILHHIAPLARLSFSAADMSRAHGDPINAEDKARLDAHFERVAQTYERDGMGVQNALCRTLL